MRRFACDCLELLGPPSGRAWLVVQDHCNHSVFNGRRYAYSQYSEIWCLRCGRFWRTRANYVNQLRRIPQDQTGDWLLGKANQEQRLDWFESTLRKEKLMLQHQENPS